MNSPVRQSLGIATEGRDYDKSVSSPQMSRSAARMTALPVNCSHQKARFATLPLQGDRANLAWYMQRGAAETLAAMPKEEAEAELNARFAEFAGEMTIEGAAGSYPLILQLATEMTGPRAALVGDAARRVNPHWRGRGSIRAFGMSRH